MSDPCRKRIKADRMRPAHNKACARCRKRKIKCDGEWPACSSCKSALVACLGYDTTLSREVPRSIATHLEGKVGSLEKKIKDLKERAEHQGRFPNSDDPNGAQGDAMFLFHNALYLQQSSLPLPFPPETRYPSRDELGGRKSPKAINLSGVPRAAVDLMFKNYVETLLIRHPCVDERELLEGYTKCFDSPGRASSFDIFIVYMALAISAATLIWKNEQRALSASAGFFAKAKDMLALPALCDTEIQQIQVALLLTHYSFTNPTAVEAWYCIGDASRRCINLGLHKEAGPEMRLNTRELETRRRIFWTACSLERSICSQLRLPFLLNETDITTQFCSTLRDAPRLFDSLVEGRPRKGYDPPMFRYRLLETEAYRMLWTRKQQDNSVPLEDWLRSFNTRLDDWCSYARGREFEEKSLQKSKHILELSSLGRNLLRGRLYRPTPRVMYPSQESRLEYIKTAMAVADHYTKYCQQHRLIYPWFAGHNLFEIAIVTLDTAWLGSDWLSQYLDLEQVINCINDFPRLLREVALFWPAVGACADTVATLAEPVICRLDAICKYTEPPARDHVISNTLAWYLFPDSAFASEQRTGSVNLNDIELLDNGDIVMDGFEDFDWDMGSLNQGLFNSDFI